MHYFFAGILLLVYLVFCWCCWRNYQHRQQKIVASHPTALNSTANEILIAYASQSGSAATLASQTALQLQDAGKESIRVALNQLTPALLAQAKTLLVIASTYGEGEAPDNGNRFIARTLGKLQQNSLQHLQVAILGLGDSSYQHFCGFAHQLQHELQYRGARFLTDLIEVDKLEDSALRHWQYYLGQISGQSHYPDWSKPAYGQWKIVQRECINSGSPGAPAFHLKLIPLTDFIAADAWHAGDIAEIGPGNSAQTIQHFLQQLDRQTIVPEDLLYSDLAFAQERLAELKQLDDETLLKSLPDLPHREYSIASVPAENSLDLLVRQVNIAPGHYGLGSGWLSVHAQLQQPIRLRIRPNTHFHSPTTNCPLILIGNGTGIAGLRAHLANPLRAGTRNWLLFGERTAAADSFFNSDLVHWQKTGVLVRLDQVFSRDAQPGAARYVQDLLQPNAREIRQWVNEGAAIFVCGSLQGMAQAVDDTLRTILGTQQLESLADQRRYCRDVY